LKIRDKRVKDHLDNSVAEFGAKQADNKRQMPEWRESGKPNFRFKEDVQSAARNVFVEGAPSAPCDDILPDVAIPLVLLLPQGIPCDHFHAPSPLTPPDDEGADDEGVSYDTSRVQQVWKPEPDWAKLETPWPPTQPYHILFVGANNRDQDHLDVKEEGKKIQTEFWAANGSIVGEHNVILSADFSPSTSTLKTCLQKYNPVILHFACHGDDTALTLFEEDLQLDDLVKIIANFTAWHGKRLQLIVLNSCKSDHIAQALREHVDFVIGHVDEVADEDALDFAGHLYRGLASSESLLRSFDWAKTGSHHHAMMTGRKNAAEFRLVLRGEDTTTETMVKFFKDKGFKEIAERLCKDLRITGYPLEALGVVLQAVEDESQCTWLKKHERKYLVHSISTFIAHCISVGGGVRVEQNEEDGERSQAGTPFGSPRTHEVVGIHHHGNPKALRQHVKCLLQEFESGGWVERMKWQEVVKWLKGMDINGKTLRLVEENTVCMDIGLVCANIGLISFH